MKRLTYIDQFNRWTVDGHVSSFSTGYEGSPSKIRGEVVDRLAAYESTGLEPEEVAEMCGEIKTAYDNDGEPYLFEAEGNQAKHITELLQAEYEGRLLVPPCRVGEIVWALWPALVKDKYVIYCAEVKEIKMAEILSMVLEPLEFRGRRKEYFLEDFGKTVFLNSEDAEKALEKI